MRKMLLFLMINALVVNASGQNITITSPVKMLALGDSYTIGQSVEVSERWPHQFVAELRKSGVEAGDPDYIATTGWTTRDLQKGMRTLRDREKQYNLVSILIGVNNQYQGVAIASYEPDLREIIDSALVITSQDTGRVFILSIPDYAFTPFGNGNASISKEIDDYNAIKRRVAGEYGITFIDVTPISRRGLNEPDLVASDGLHPSGKQYELWVREILPYLDMNQSTTVRTAAWQKDPDPVFNIRPNPAKGSLWIDLPENAFPGSVPEMVFISDINGTIRKKVTVDQFPLEIHVAGLQPGSYLLAWTTGEGHRSVPFILH